MGKGFRLLMVTVLALSLTFFASGCSKKTTTDAEVAPVGMATADSAPAGERIEAVEESLESMKMRRDREILEGRTSAAMLPVYFDYDKTNIRADQQVRMEKNAAYLKESRSVIIRIEGNSDERGTNEYNMALGERRAQSAKKYLVNLGISEDRINIVSYGEDRPLLYGHDELSWAQNRRADFVISN